MGVRLSIRAIVIKIQAMFISVQWVQLTALASLHAFMKKVRSDSLHLNYMPRKLNSNKNNLTYIFHVFDRMLGNAIHM